MSAHDSIAKTWVVQIDLGEHEGRTRAVARMTEGPAVGVATGMARLSPRDRDVPEIGDELAAGRALFGLAQQLIEAATAEIERSTHEKRRHADLSWTD
jgi:hypothetical protein